MVTGDKGLAGAFNTNILKAAARFLESKAGKNIDIEAIGRKGRDFLRRRFPAAKVQTQSLADLAESIEVEPKAAERAGAIEITGEHVGILEQGRICAGFRAGAERDRALHARRDRLCLPGLQRIQVGDRAALMVEQILPIEQIGEQTVRLAEEMTEEEKKKAKEAAISAGVGMRGPDRAGGSGRERVWHCAGGLHLRAVAGRAVPRRCCRSMSASRFSVRCWNRWRPSTRPA